MKSKNILVNLKLENLEDLIPKNFNKKNNLRRTGQAGIFAGSFGIGKRGKYINKTRKII